jgi:DNA-binding NtrC family response regulator
VRVDLNSSGPRRKVLIVEGDASIRNTLYVLLAGLDCESEVAYDGQQALRMISRESFDAVLLDLRSSLVPGEEMVAQIKRLSPSLVGRVLVITGEVADPKTLEWIESQCLTSVAGNRLMSDLWGRLRVLLGLAPPAENRS